MLPVTTGFFFCATAVGLGNIDASAYSEAIREMQ